MNSYCRLFSQSLVFVCFAIGAMTTKYASAEPVSILCFDNEPIGQIEQLEALRSIKVVGHVAYAGGARSQDITLYDISDPSQPTLIGSIPDTLRANVVGVEGDRLYIFGSSTGFRIMDVSDPTNPQFLEMFSGGDGYVLTTFNQRAYFIEDTQVLAYDLSEGNVGQLLGSIDLVNPLRAFHVADGYGYAAMSNELRVIDLHDLEDMQVVATYPDFGSSSTLVSSGDFLYLKSEGLSVLDISDPLSITLITDSIMPGLDERARIVGDHLYTLDSDFGLLIYDLVDPASPELVGTCLVSAEAYEYVIDEEQAYVVVADNLLVFDIARPVTSITGSVDAHFSAFGSALSNNQLWVAGDQQGLAVFDISGEGDPILIQNHSSYARVRQIIIEDDLAYISGPDMGFQILDISPGESPSLVGQYPALGVISLVGKSDNYVFLYDDTQYDKLLILDVADPTHPRWISSYQPRSYVFDVEFYQDTMYVATSLDGIAIFDMRNPFVPVFIDRYEGDRVHAIEVLNDNLIAASFEMIVYDLDDPRHPVERSRSQIVSQRLIREMITVGTRLIFHREDPDIYAWRSIGVVDVADPDLPELLGVYPQFERIASLEVFDHRISAVTSEGVIYMLDYSENCESCRADFNGDGVLNFFDIAEFLIAFASQSPAADLHEDDLYNFFDISAFLIAFNATCP